MPSSTVEDIVNCFDINVCSVAMLLNPAGGGCDRQFAASGQVRDAIRDRRARCEYVDNVLLPQRVAKYEARGFTFDEAWRSEHQAVKDTWPTLPESEVID
jgi:hypothetical protein